MIKTSRFISTISFVLVGMYTYTEAADVNILDLNVRAHVTLNKNSTKNNGGGVKFVNYIMKHKFDFVTTQEGDGSTYNLTSENLGKMKDFYVKNPEARIYYNKADWELESKYDRKIKLTPDEIYDGGTGERFASLSVFKSKKSDHTQGRYITIVSTHYCIDWWWADAAGKHGSKGCALSKNTDNLDIINSYLLEAEQMAKELGVNKLGKDFGIEKSVTRQITAHVNDSVKIANAINDINVLIENDQKAKQVKPTGSAVFFVGDLNNQYVINPDVEKDVKNSEKIILSALEASAVQAVLKTKGFMLTTFTDGIYPRFMDGPIIDFAYYRGLTQVSTSIYARNGVAEVEQEKNTSDHDGMNLSYDFIK